MKFPVFGASNDDPGTAGAYAYLASTHNIAWDTTEARRQIPLSEDVTVSDFKVIIDTAPGAGNSRTYTIRQNGADTAVTLTISDTATSGTWSGSVSLTAGDLVDIKETGTGTPTAPGNAYWSTFLNTTGQKALIMGAHANVVSTSATNYGNPFGGTAWATVSADQDIVVSTGGNVTAARYFSSAAPGASKSYAVSLRLNNTSDLLTGTISGAGTTTASATGTTALAAGDTLQMKSVPSGTPTTAALAWCYTFEPTTNGESIVGFGLATALSTSATQYNQPLGIGAGYSTTESGRLLKLPAVSIKNLYVRLGTAPGIGSTRTITWRDNSASSSLTVAITGTNTTGSDTTHTVTHTADQAAGIQSAITVTPAASTLHIGYTIVTTQPVASTATAGTMPMMGV